MSGGACPSTIDSCCGGVVWVCPRSCCFSGWSGWPRTLAHDVVVQPAGDGHGAGHPDVGSYVAYLPTSLALCLTLAAAIATGVALGKHWAGRSGRSLWLFGLVPVLGFAADTLVEATSRGSTAETTAALVPVFLIGLLVQVPFALVVVGLVGGVFWLVEHLAYVLRESVEIGPRGGPESCLGCRRRGRTGAPSHRRRPLAGAASPARALASGATGAARLRPRAHHPRGRRAARAPVTLRTEASVPDPADAELPQGSSPSGRSSAGASGEPAPSLPDTSATAPALGLWPAQGTQVNLSPQERASTISLLWDAAVS